MSESPLSLEAAQLILADYGKLLSSIQPSLYGLPESLLPHSKDSIKQAIRRLLTDGAIDDTPIRNSLIEAYVFLAYFILDADAELMSGSGSLLDCQSHEQIDLERSVTGHRLVNNIKLEMERLLQEIEWLQNTQQFDDPGV